MNMLKRIFINNSLFIRSYTSKAKRSLLNQDVTKINGKKIPPGDTENNTIHLYHYF